MFKQVDTQLIFLHLLGGTLFFLKGIELSLIKEKVKELNNNIFLIALLLGVLSILSALVNDYFYTSVLGSYQIGQGALWYFDLAILVLCFSSLLKNRKLQYFFFHQHFSFNYISYYYLLFSHFGKESIFLFSTLMTISAILA